MLLGFLFFVLAFLLLDWEMFVGLLALVFIALFGIALGIVYVIVVIIAVFVDGFNRVFR